MRIQLNSLVTNQATVAIQVGEQGSASKPNDHSTFLASSDIFDIEQGEEKMAPLEQRASRPRRQLDSFSSFKKSISQDLDDQNEQVTTQTSSVKDKTANAPLAVSMKVNMKRINNTANTKDNSRQTINANYTRKSSDENML